MNTVTPELPLRPTSTTPLSFVSLKTVPLMSRIGEAEVLVEVKRVCRHK